MDILIIIISKYLFIFLMFFYAWGSFCALQMKREKQKNTIFWIQNFIIFLTYILGLVLIFINQQDTADVNVIIFGGLQLCYLIIALGVFPIIYPTINKSILSNMCMLLTIGFIILARLGFEKSVTQFIIVSVVTIASLVVPFLMSRFELWRNLTWFYCLVGLVLLIGVIIFGPMTNGARLYFKIANRITFQPSEFVKIIFVFFIAGMFAKAQDFRRVVLASIFAGLYVIILVLSTDLGSALIFFTMYLFMLYVATRKALYLIAGMGGISLASVIAYHLFYHVQVRVLVWKNPFAPEIINDKGYQVAHSLFALGSGGLSGTGLYQGYPNKIPLVENDFIFSAIGEEFGSIFAILLLLVCLSCFIGFLKAAMAQVSLFNRLVCVGLGVGYAIQVILTVGGAMNMIPSTGVTLPLISSGGSSILSTLIVFAIIQGMAIVGTSNQEREKRMEHAEGVRYVSTDKSVKVRRR